MTNHEFRCWIDGFASMTDETQFTHRQYVIIKNHANLVKAMSKQLDDDISSFLDLIKNELTSAQTLPMSKFKTIFKTLAGC